MTLNEDSPGMTADALHIILSQRIEDLARRMDERHATQQEEIQAGHDSIREFFNTRIADILNAGVVRQEMLDERYISQTKAIETALDAQRRGVDKALEAAEKAIDQRQNNADREFHEHLAQVRHENALAFTNADKAVGAALMAQKEAVHKAETANEKRFEGVNEFREQLNDQARTFSSRTEAASNFQRYDDRISDLQHRMDKNEGSTAGKSSLFGAMIAVATIILTIVIFFANYLTG